MLLDIHITLSEGVEIALITGIATILLWGFSKMFDYCAAFIKMTNEMKNNSLLHEERIEKLNEKYLDHECWLKEHDRKIEQLQTMHK